MYLVPGSKAERHGRRGTTSIELVFLHNLTKLHCMRGDSALRYSLLNEVGGVTKRT